MKICNIAVCMFLSLAMLSGILLGGCGSSIGEADPQTADMDSAEKGNRSEESGDTAQKSTSYASMDEIKKAVVNLLAENYWPDRQLTENELEMETGITKDMYQEYMADEMNTETDIDTMIICLAKEEKLSEIEDLLNEYRDNLMVKYKDRPQELGKVEASRIEIVENYVCFVQLGADTSAAAEGGDEEVMALCQQENERAIDVIEKTILE